MSPRPVLIIHAQAEVREQLRIILGEEENEYLEAASRREAAPLLSRPPSLVISHFDEFKKLIADLERKAPGATRVVLSPPGDADAREELESIASGGFDFLTLDDDAMWKLKALVRRRASPRHPAPVPIDATLITRGLTVGATCIDVSNEGVGLLVAASSNLAALMPGEAVVLTGLKRGDCVLMEQMPCSVQTVRRVGNNALQVGLSFEIARRVPTAPMRITNALRIYALLKSASTGGAAFSLSGDDGTVAQVFTAARLEEGRIRLTEPTSPQRLQWLPGQAVRFSFELNGRQLSGYAGVLGANPESVSLAVPRALLQVNRRSSLRLPAGTVRASVTVVSPLSGRPVTRKVLDLSSIGASFQVDPSVDVFPPGLRLEGVELELEGRRLQVSATVASMAPSSTEEDGERRCGLQFTHIEPGDRQLLLDLLVRHRVAGVECGSQIPFEKIWDLFTDEGAVWRDHSTLGQPLAPARTHEQLGDGAHGLSKSFVILQDGELAGHTSGLRIYSRTWLSQHLMVKSGYHRAAALSQQLMCLSFDYGEALPDIEYVRGLWRVSNRWAERIYGAVSVRLLRPGLSYRVRFEPMRMPLTRAFEPGPLRVREATPDDERDFLSLVNASEDPVKALSDDLIPGELHLESLSTRYAARGLTRVRTLTVVEDAHGTPLGWGLQETMSPGLFWAEMYTSFRMFLLDPQGAQASAARVSLASDAAQTRARLGQKEVECHASGADVADLEAMGFVSLGPVYEFGAHRSIVRELTSQMISVFARIRRREKDESTHVEPEAEAATA
jgi:hypothetical protein